MSYFRILRHSRFLKNRNSFKLLEKPSLPGPFKIFILPRVVRPVVERHGYYEHVLGSK